MNVDDPPEPPRPVRQRTGRAQSRSEPAPIIAAPAVMQDTGREPATDATEDRQPAGVAAPSPAPQPGSAPVTTTAGAPETAHVAGTHSAVAEDLDELDPKRLARRPPQNVAASPIRETGADYNLVKAQEETRSHLARWLLYLLIGTVVLSISLLAAGRLTTDDVGSVLSPVVALTGTALGFYFGGRGHTNN
jgi:hypothetical protein